MDLEIGQKVNATIFGMGPYESEIIGFKRIDDKILVRIRTNFGVCTLPVSEITPFKGVFYCLFLVGNRHNFPNPCLHW